MKTISPIQASADALAPLVKHAEANRGTILDLASRLSARTGQTIYRQYVEKWIHPEADKRVEPKLGIGLLMIEEGDKLIRESKKKKAVK